MHIEDIYISLIVRYLKKEISETEKQELFHWVCDNNENEKFFYNLKDIWETAQYKSIALGADTEIEWEKLALAAIQKESEHYYERRINTRNIIKAIQIAAIVVITFGVGFFVQKFIPEKTYFASINVPYGAKSELFLPDGSKVWINSGSTLKYPTSIDNKEVNLFLEGEAFFEIVKNPKRILNVKTSTINIQVHGTTFNVKSYNDDDLVETTLLEGSISITGKVGKKIIKEPIFLKPNEQATLTKSVNKIAVRPNREVLPDKIETRNTQSEIKEILPKAEPHINISEGVETMSFVAWKNNILYFKNERFEDLIVKMERWYDVRIVINDSELKESRYTGTFEKETIEQAMKALSLSLPFTYEIRKNQIEIMRETN